jgi:hypothetical protein
MIVREEFLELLRTDQTFREEVRRQLLSEDLLALPGKFDHLTELVGQALSLLRETVGVVRDLVEAQRRTEERIGRLDGRMDRVETALEQLIEAQQRTEDGLQRQGEQIQALTQAQQRTEEELRWLVSWQRGEAGRRDGERYEREIIRRAPALFNGGQGGAPDQPSVQQRLAEQLRSLLAQGVFESVEDPFLADLLWWKSAQIAVVEVSIQVNGDDVVRAARRAATLRRAGAPALAVVIGEDWAISDARELALARQVEWKVGSDLSEGFLAFRRLSH